MGSFAERLKELRLARPGLTQDKAAGELGLTRGAWAQWETGRNLPDEDKVSELDRVLAADGELLRLFAEERGVAPRQRRSLADVFDGVSRALQDTFLIREEGRPAGWCHRLGESDKATPLSSAIGLRTLALLDSARIELEPVVDRIVQRKAHGGWSNRRLEHPRPEVTAIVLDALSALGAAAGMNDAWRFLESAVDDDLARRHPYVYTAVLETLAKRRPESTALTPLVDRLLEARLVALEGEPGLWPSAHRVVPEPRGAATGAGDVRSAGRGRMQPSVAHTARAVVALRLARPAYAGEQDIEGAIAAAVGWLAESRRDDGIGETLRVRPDDRLLDVPINHFTSAWILRALAGEGVPRARLDAAAKTAWESYSEADGVWEWNAEGTFPIWMTCDAVQAFRRMALHEFDTLHAPAPGGPR